MLIGETLGSFRILRQIGAGGMGAVYYAQHQLIGRKAAIKVLHPALSKESDLVQRFFNEARAAAMIRHPGLIEVFDFGYYRNGAAYLVMEYLEGETLAQKLKRERQLPVWILAAIMRQVASALYAAHVHGIVHRDLKPENIFLSPERSALAGLRVKVLDFGVAKLSGEALLGANSPHTRTGSMLGTPQYMAPEQCRGAAHVDHRADIYSMGCIMFEALAGRKLFVARGLGELLAMHQRMQPPPMTSIDPSLPYEFDALLQRMLAKRPEERPQSMEEVEVALETMSATHGWDAMLSRGLMSSSNAGTPMPSMASYPGVPVPSMGGGPAQMHPSQAFSHPQVHPSQAFSQPQMHPSQAFSQPQMHPSQAFSQPQMQPSQTASRPPASRPGKTPWLIAGIVMAGFAGLVVFLLTRGGAPPPASPVATGSPAPAAATPPAPSPSATPPAAPATTAPQPSATPPVAAATPSSAPDAATPSPSPLAEASPSPSPSPSPAATPPAEPAASPQPVVAEAGADAQVAPRAAAEPAQGSDAGALVKLDIESVPPGAEVVRADDGKSLGKTPLHLERAPGTGETQFVLRMAGYGDAKLAVPADRDDRERVELVKETPAAEPTAKPAPAPPPAHAQPKKKHKKRRRRIEL